MSIKKDVKYCRLILLVCKCGREITKAVFQKVVHDSTPENHEPFPWTVDHFLENKREDILKDDVGKRNRYKLFPGFAKTAKLDEWDIWLLCHLLLRFGKLQSKLFHDIKYLSKLRNKLSHRGEKFGITDKKYDTYMERINGVFMRCSEDVGNTALYDDVQKYISQVETLNTDDVTEAEMILEQWNEIGNYRIKVSIKNGSADPNEIKTTLQEYQVKYEEKNVSTELDLSFKVNIHIDGDNMSAEQALRSIQTGGASTSSEMTIALSIERVRADVRQIGSEVENYTIGSILFRFTSFSLTSLIYLVDYFNGPVFGRRIQCIQDALEEMTDENVDLEISIPLETKQGLIQKLEEGLNQRPEVKRQNIYGKVFNDPIHGQIELHPLCVEVVDTPQFQRLRHIKQLDTCYLVYPGASHNRFQHSIGTCYLAGKLLRALKERQPELDITSKDILCVKIAALCHDIGQGPFSHVFERKFLPAVNENSDWKHEKGAVKMFEYMLNANGGKLHQQFLEFIPSFDEDDIQFIKEMIDVPMDTSRRWPYKGRDKHKSFLYEVVANGENGIDVDKWDYIARDSLMLGMKTNFDHDRCILSARVIVADGRKHICYREKSSQDLYDMFYTRMALHRRAYQHKTHNIIGTMIRDALLAANDTFLLTGENGARIRISDSINDMKAYTHVTDDILQEIMLSSEKGLEKSKRLINRINQRDFYKCVAQTQVDVKQVIQAKISKERMIVGHPCPKGWIEKIAVQENLFSKINNSISLENLEEKIEIDVVNVEFGRKDEDPVSKVWFYKNTDEDTPVRIKKEHVSHVLPDTFAEQYIRVYSSIEDKELFEVTEKSFAEWCIENGIPPPKVNGSSIGTRRHTDGREVYRNALKFKKIPDETSMPENNNWRGRKMKAIPDLFMLEPANIPEMNINADGHNVPDRRFQPQRERRLQNRYTDYILDFEQ